ncbi:MAG: PASTA domain-containing protein [Gaiellaceae bacterium]
MAFWPKALLPRVSAIVVLGVFATTTLTFAAERRLQASNAPKATITPPATDTLIVPDVQGQAYVFAEGVLQDAGFGWRVSGGNGFAANTVASQSPAAGTRVADTGAPLVTVSLVKAKGYAERGAPVNVSPYAPTEVRLAGSVPATATPSAATPTAPAAPAAPAAKQAVKHAASAAPAAKAPASRKPDFVVAGAPKEPAKEMPLVDRAVMLDTWLASHKQNTSANVGHWLYQNAWIVTGAKFGWWHGAQALRVLIAADRKAQRQWGLGAKSEQAARAALAEVKARAR